MKTTMVKLCTSVSAYQFLLLMVSTSQATLVCPGGNLTLTCHTNGPSLRWVITFPYYYLPEARIISSKGPADSQTPLFENPTLFQFLRISRVPPMSTMLIDNITSNLNGTRIDCWFNEGKSTIIIDVIGNAFQSVTRVESEKFQSENVTITLNWAKGDNEFYNVSTIPHVPNMLHIESTTIELLLLYNTWYSVSIVAFLCEYNTTEIVELHYVNCGMPVHMDTSTIHIDYNSTWVNSVLHFRCKGLFPTNIFTSTCLENGAWNPNPAKHICTEPSGNVLTSVEQNAVIGSTVSSITVCVLSSVLFFIIGCVCGHKYWQEIFSSNLTPRPQVAQPNPMYEEVGLPVSAPAITNQFELKENVAYDPLN